MSFGLVTPARLEDIRITEQNRDMRVSFSFRAFRPTQKPNSDVVISLCEGDMG